MPGEIVFRLLSWLYFPLVAMRNFCYDAGILAVARFPVAVISVGNITTGGTGKTPFVEYLVRYFSRDCRVAVVSRGYGRSTAGTQIVSDGTRLFGDAASMGDEAYQIARKFPDIWVVVDEDRVRGLRTLLTKSRPDVVLLDDGFQHRGLGRDLDIVMIDGTRPLRSVAVQPRGFRREPLSSLRRAGVLAVTRRKPAETLEAELRAFSSAPVIGILLEPVRLRSVFAGDARPLAHLKGRSCITLCAVGNPDSFRAVVHGLGAEIEREFIYPDHQDYRRLSLEPVRAALASQACDCLLTTEKDAVRLLAAGCGSSLPQNACYYIELEARVVTGEPVLRSALEQARKAAA